MTVMKRTLAFGALVMLAAVGLVGCIRLPSIPGQGHPAATVPAGTQTTTPVSTTSTLGPDAVATATPATTGQQPSANAVPSAALHTPKIGSAERKAILDTLRPPVQSTLHQPVVFKCDVFKVELGWAFVRGTPVRPDGGKIDYRKTKYKAALDEGFFDDGFAALLRFKSGSWHITKWEIGATDVAWEPWADDYGAPRAIF